MKRILFLDRDGTIIEENSKNYQIDSIEKINFYPRVIFFLSKIKKELNYDLVMISNQDGLGTDEFPEEKFWPIHNHILNVLKSEDIIFSSVHIDKTFRKDKSFTRKPGIKMLNTYLNNKSLYDISRSFVIGDRLTDILLAKNLGCKSIWIRKNNRHYEDFTEEEIDYYHNLNKSKLNNLISLKTDNWKEIYQYLLSIENKNKSIYIRKTSETNVKIGLTIYGNGKHNINTGIGFFDHLLQQISIHSLMDIDILVKGDLQVDEHHTIEDSGITFGKIFSRCLNDKRGIERYGFYILPMDDCLSKVALDLGGREQLLWKVKFFREKIGSIPTEMFYHFFKSFCSSAKCNIHIHSIGINEHHKIESIFKCFARAIKMAINKNNYNNKILSSKGVLE
ncbi:bifunctional histidinol-phosphatase/imidazoleglycerol-phosphate dehydratase HisB [Blattabacterium cuenoti]|uniref:bifunctional histidinol-phosphatase/imidazoleglycerol-phosphate dehydratase HisB n=1 Tax=Blattabacterium cuenoti TaxID=1653831 RepID=UPI00163C58B6|nr:bifunctional histidinol-phosphatase/imidazoleglycerol-phosphate dehydratase HisB [Blattabacterium cuenoti]